MELVSVGVKRRTELKTSISPRLTSKQNSKKKMPKGFQGFQKGNRLGATRFRELHYNWSKRPSYRALHLRIERLYGKPSVCENTTCKYPRTNSLGKVIAKPKKFHWANKSGKYNTEKRTDWIRLCRSCHSYYDYGTLSNLIKYV